MRYLLLLLVSIVISTCTHLAAPSLSLAQNAQENRACAASGKLWLAPAYPDRLVGPKKAKGAVVWSHGRSLNSEDSSAPTPGYIGILQDYGWDSFRFNRMSKFDSLHDSSEVLTDCVQDLKARGYDRVVLAGQSFGAFLSLIAANMSSDVYAVIATAPAAFGSFSEYYDSWRLNADRLYPLLENLKAPRIIIFLFHGDDFDPGGRGERAEDILRNKRPSPLSIVVDQPQGLVSHYAANTSDFVKRFGECIATFLNTKDGMPIFCKDGVPQQHADGR